MPLRQELPKHLLAESQLREAVARSLDSPTPRSASRGATAIPKDDTLQLHRFIMSTCAARGHRQRFGVLQRLGLVQFLLVSFLFRCHGLFSLLRIAPVGSHHIVGSAFSRPCQPNRSLIWPR